MSNLQTLPKGDSAWLFRKALQRIIQQISVLETNIGSSTTGNSANTQVIFNDNGVLRGDAGLTYNATTDLLTVGAATITGDLTVKTNVLKVDTLNNRVGINTASPAYAFDNRGVLASGNPAGTIVGGITYSTRPEIGSLSNNDVGFIANSVTQYLIAVGGTHTWYNSGSTAMTLNSTGLGVFNSPVAALDVYKVANDTINRTNATFCFGQIAGLGAALLGQQSASAPYQFNLQAANAANSVQFPLVLQPSGGNVGVGVTPSYKLDVAGIMRLGGTTNPVIRLETGTNTGFVDYDNTRLQFHAGPLPMYFVAGNTLKMTLDASGNLLVGVANSGNRLDIQKSTDCTVLVKSTGANTNIAMDYVSSYGNHTIRKSGTAVWDFGVINDATATPAFKISNASAVGVQLVSGATAWTTLSDETVKDIIEPIGNAVAKVGSLRSVIGKFKTDSEGTRRSFLIAQDVKSVLPEAVDVVGENNELGLRYTEVIPLLVAAIKELTARVEALEA